MAAPEMLTTKWRPLSLTGESNADVFVVFACDCAAGGTSAANYWEREIRHVLVLKAALGQAMRLAHVRNVRRLGPLRQSARKGEKARTRDVSFWHMVSVRCDAQIRSPLKA